ncbi:DUF1302 family protein [Spectribacter hydrogenooxidans]|uniref:DUF1302 family protein n=1 Tax=Spectribacter hydrogenoxidans TaxID=3075608 RepID=A0ABU3C450_9GAMM|nr:DUF1302 family protein [Salinisphaera sp. W335]MDT0636341.1 DUF1302 family protein [Salinisphaera sp. W335]
MNETRLSNLVRMVTGGALVLCTTFVWAAPAGPPSGNEGFFERLWGKTTLSTFIRAEGSVRTTSAQNINNQTTNMFQKVAVPRQTFVPPTLAGMPLTDGNDWNTPLPAFSDVLRRGDRVPTKERDYNYTVLRAQSELQMKFTRSWRFVGRVRGVYDPGFYEEFDAGSVADQQGTGIIGGPPELYQGSPNYFEALGRNGKNINPLEFAGENYLIDFPALLVEYKEGNLTLRAGNQQIAWGQAIFFRTLDVVNGLDLRRHSLLDRAFEEFSDKRVPKLSLRGTYQLGSIVIDSYVGKFQPRIYGNPNTSFNVIPAQFTVYDNYYSGGYDNEIDGGFRMKADYGNWGWQAMAVTRMHPAGTFSWARSGVESPLTGTLGETANTAYAVKLPTCDGTENPTLCRNSENPGEALSKTNFVPEPGGVYTAREWFTYAADARLDGIGGFNQAVEEFPDLKDVYVTKVQSYDELFNQLNTLMVAAGGSYRGYIERDYHREDVYGLGLSYVTSSENSLLNQIILNLEVQYTPERVFTAPTLSSSFLKTDEWIASLVVEKWTRWTAAFPAAYLVGQFQHRSESDLVGRHLSGYGASETNAPPPGISSANYLVLAAMQPWPGREFVFEFATLLDIKGGILVQPLLQWNLGNGMIAEFFYNFIDGNLYGEPTENTLSSVDWADEVAVRFKYQF